MPSLPRTPSPDATWHAIPGMEGRYDIRADGAIRSWVARGVPLPHPIKPHHKTPGPYLGVVLHPTRGSGLRNHYLHRLLALTFIGPCPEGMEVRHLNGDCQDNRLENLAYGTHSQNMHEQVRHGTHANGGKTHCKRGHEFTPQNTIRTSRGYRRCRTCTEARKRRPAQEAAA